jgi:CMP-N,N'-diacetyllegionaminic acid synthase
MKNKSVALIPARSGSKRVPNKNIKLLGGHPMLAYTVRAAIDSGVFDTVICATDSPLYAEIAAYYGAEVPLLRTSDISGDKSPDIEWVMWILQKLKENGKVFEIYSILRPTNPFRKPDMIIRAWRSFIDNPHVDSLRAIQKCKEHPGKMWMVRNERMLPLMPFSNGSTPWHSSQYASLPEVYIQNASLEIAWSRIVFERNSIAGENILPFVSNGNEGFDINQVEDLILAEYYLANNQVDLPLISIPPYKFKNGV